MFDEAARMSKEATKTLMSEEDDPYNMHAAQDLLMDGQKKLVIVSQVFYFSPLIVLSGEDTIQRSLDDGTVL